MDCGLPVLSGYETCTLIKSLVKNSGFKDAVVVANSADNSQRHRDLCQQSGMQLVLSKPTTRAHFVKTIENLVTEIVKKMQFK